MLLTKGVRFLRMLRTVLLFQRRELKYLKKKKRFPLRKRGIEGDLKEVASRSRASDMINKE